MNIKFFIRKSTSKIPQVTVPVYVRLRDGNLDLWHRLNIRVNPAYWDSKTQDIKSRVVINEEYRKQFRNKLTDLRQFLYDEYYKDTHNNQIGTAWLERKITDFEKEGSKPKQHNEIISIGKIFDDFISSKPRAASRRRQYEVVKRILLRYELFIQSSNRKNKNYKLDIKSLDSPTLLNIIDFIRNEHKYYEEQPDIYEQIPDKKRQPKPRGHNTVCDIMKKLRAFMNWCELTKQISQSPFKEVIIPQEVYGTPVYLTKDELKSIENADLSKYEAQYPGICEQRDIFIFQCCIGCRVSDLLRLTPDDIIDDTIEYIPDKTISENGRTVSVPLNKTAKSIIKKYSGKSPTLLPFIRSQEYNDMIKIILRLSKVHRVVTTLNPLTGKEEKKQICDIASSHMARRTFIGNLYKEVQDPAILCELSGHVQGSKAFARYRQIDKEIKKQIVTHLD